MQNDPVTEVNSVESTEKMLFSRNPQKVSLAFSYVLAELFKTDCHISYLQDFLGSKYLILVILLNIQVLIDGGWRCMLEMSSEHIMTAVIRISDQLIG